MASKAPIKGASSKGYMPRPKTTGRSKIDPYNFPSEVQPYLTKKLEPPKNPYQNPYQSPDPAIANRAYTRLSRRLTGVFVGIPVMVLTGYILYLREAFGEKQRYVEGSPSAQAAVKSQPENNERKPKMF